MIRARCCLEGQFRVFVEPSRRGWMMARRVDSPRAANGWERRQMRGLRYDRILAGTALALVLAAPFGANAQTTAAVPLPDQAVVAPPTGDDLTPPITTPSNNAVTPAGKTEPAGTME